MSLLNRTFTLFGKLLGSHRVAWNLLAERGGRGRGELRRKTRGPLAAVSHTHSRPSTSEATADKNAKKKDETGITSRSCLWIAVCILISVCVYTCVWEDSVSPDCKPKTKVDSWAYFRWSFRKNKIDRRCHGVQRKDTQEGSEHTLPWAKGKHFNAHTNSHTLISTSRHWPAG